MNSTRSTAKAVQPSKSPPFFSVQARREPAFFSPSTKPFADGERIEEGTVQAKLTMGAPGDSFEREADAMADRVVQRMHAGSVRGAGAPPIQAKCSACEEKEKVQREPTKCESCEPQLQAKASGTMEVPGSVQKSLESGHSGGNSMHPSLREDMESAFDADLSGVRIHTGSSAAQLNRDLNARAFTYGSDIFFNSGEYQPESAQGRHLLAHELTHVMQQTTPMVQRDEKKPAVADDAGCPTSIPPGTANAEYKDHSMGKSGTYYIYGRPYNKEDLGTYATATIKAWIAWQFGSLSGSVVNRIHSETSKWGWRWVPNAPDPGCQAMMRMSITDARRLLKMGGYDLKSREDQKKEKKAGLPDLPGAGGGADIVVAGQGGGSKTREQAEEALDPTSVYNKGQPGATHPPFPISMEGPEMEVPNGLGTYTARLLYEQVTDDNGMLLAYSMNSVNYHWEIFDITEILMRGMKMGNSMVEEARNTQSIAQNEPQNKKAEKAADGALRQHAVNKIDELSEETSDSLRELRDPVKAVAGGSAIDVVTRAYANFLNLELLPISAIVAAGGFLVKAFASLLGGYSKEKEIAFPDKQGYYMVRCIAQPGPRGPEKSERRAASVRAKIVEVRPPEMLARNALGLADAAIANLELQKVMTSDPKEIERIDKQIANIHEQTSGDLVTYLTRVIAEKEAAKKLLPTWEHYRAGREIESLKLRLEQVKNKRSGTGSTRIRPKVAFTSTITGETYPLMIELSPIPVVDDDGNEVKDVKKIRLFDATVPDREEIDRTGSTYDEAVDHVFEMFRKNGDYGSGILFVQMPSWWSGKREFTLRVSASGGAVVKKRLEDLAMALLVLSMVVPGVGEISMAIAAGLAAHRMISRALNGTLRLDADSVGDTLAILGAVAQGAQLVGKLRVAKSGNAFVAAFRSTEQGALQAAADKLATVVRTQKVLDMTSVVVNAGGLIWGDLVMVNELSKIAAQEMNGTITHAEASRLRAGILSNAFVTHGVMLHGALKPQGADRVGGTTEKTATPPHEEGAPKPGEKASKREGPPETIPERELEQRANAPAKPDTEGAPTAQKDNVRTRFRTPDNLHEIFILEDGRIFRCSLLCSQLQDWYGSYLSKQPPGTRHDRAVELSGQLEKLSARSKAGEKTPELEHDIGALDVAMREFIAPDLARDLQKGFESRPGAKPGEKFLDVDQVRQLLKFFNLDEIVRFAESGGLSAKVASDLVASLAAIDRFATAGDRAAMRPVLEKIAAGGEPAASAIDFLNRVALIHGVPKLKFSLVDLIAAHERGDAILAKNDLQSGVFLEDRFGPYELEAGKLRLNGEDSRMPYGLTPKGEWHGIIDFVLIEIPGGGARLVLGQEHTGLSGGRASVFGAGRLFVNKDGFVVKIDRRSGHYRPSVENFRRAVQFLVEKNRLMAEPMARLEGRPVMEVDPTFE